MKLIKDLQPGDPVYVVEQDPRTQKIHKKVVPCVFSNIEFSPSHADNEGYIRARFSGTMKCLNGKKFTTRADFQVVKVSTVDTCSPTSRISNAKFYELRDTHGIRPEEYETVLNSTHFLFYDHFNIFTDESEAKMFIKGQTASKKDKGISPATKKELVRILEGCIEDAAKISNEAAVTPYMKLAKQEADTCLMLFDILLKNIQK